MSDMQPAEKDAAPFTHLGITHPNGDQCVWLEGVGWFVPLDAGGEGYGCPHDHPVAEKDALARLIDKHASHGFGGVMRAPDDGCPVYVAAVALFDALGLGGCPIPPVVGQQP